VVLAGAGVVSAALLACCLLRLPAVLQRVSSSGMTSHGCGAAYWMRSREMWR
jgi:hypothetical protein